MMIALLPYMRTLDGSPCQHADSRISSGDGKADYIWLSTEGAATVYINVMGENPANWLPLNGGQPLASGLGGSRQDIRFADIE